MEIKFVMKHDTFNVINVYAPEVGFEEQWKINF